MATNNTVTGTMVLQGLKISLDQLLEEQSASALNINEIKKNSIETAKQLNDLLKVVGELNELIHEVKNQVSLVGTTKAVKMTTKAPIDIPTAAKAASEGAIVKAPISKAALIKQLLRGDVKEFEQISTPAVFVKISALLETEQGKAALTAAKAGNGLKFTAICTTIGKHIGEVINEDDESKQKLTTEFNRLKQSALLENKTPAGVEV